MTYEQFCYKARNAMHETIYTDSEGREILIIRLLDAYSLLTPPRPWVGLTEDDYELRVSEEWKDGMSYAEAKLKEKNT